MFALPRVIPCCWGGKCLSHGMGAAGSWQCSCWLSLWGGDFGAPIPGLWGSAKDQTAQQSTSGGKASPPLLLLSMACLSCIQQLTHLPQPVSRATAEMPAGSSFWSFQLLQEQDSCPHEQGFVGLSANPPHPGLGFIPSLISPGENLPDP